MLSVNTWGIPRLTHVFQNLKCLTLTRNRSKISEKGEYLKRIKKEEKLLFGKLLENRKQKLKRQKLENSGKIQKIESSTSDSELAWMQSVSKLIPIKLRKNSEDTSKYNSEKNFNLTSNSEFSETNGTNQSKVVLDTTQDVKSTKFSEPSPKYNRERNSNFNSNSYVSKNKERRSNRDEPKVVLENTRGAIENVKLQINKPNEVSVSSDILKNIFQFSIFENSKPLADEWTDTCKTLSVTWAQNRSCLNYPTVTKVLQATLSEAATQALEKWKLKMMDKLGVKGFEIYHADLLKDGKVFHAGVMNNLIEKPYEIPDKMKPTFDSLKQVFEDIRQVRAVESQVVHSKLLYRGILDCIVIYRDELCLIDWKKSDTAKRTISDTYDAPIQVASYIGASNIDLHYPFQIKKGIIVVAYTNGAPASVFEVTGDLLQIYWKFWLQRLQDYHLGSPMQ